MDLEQPTCSKTTTNQFDDELSELRALNVWATNQQTLEKQALNEIAILTKSKTNELDVDLFIKRQEELKKRQDYRKSLRQNDEAVRDEPRTKKRQKSYDVEASSDSDCDISKPIEPNVKLTKRTIDDALVTNYKKRLKKSAFKQEIEVHKLGNGLELPLNVWNALYSYQKRGVEWLWELHGQEQGGILGDEMGLGKTVEIIAFLYALECSAVRSKCGKFIGLGPSIIVCPATVLQQWLRHFHRWAPMFRVALLHQTGTFIGPKTQLIRTINKSKGILITTYESVVKHKLALLKYRWHYVILDEGHKIRNSNAKVTVAVKLLQTPHRLILTGTPMQNNLQELWSLYDFTNPGLLGGAQMFQEHFATPIVQGGWTNATPMQEATALSMAVALKQLITPFLMRRTKEQVQRHLQLPQKSEQVLFCALTTEQRDLYTNYLTGGFIGRILKDSPKNLACLDNGTKGRVFKAITVLRKICNHPDLYSDELQERSGHHYKKSGKMVVVSALLKIWKKQQHRVLLFTQSRSMLTIFTEFLAKYNYKYLKMDGATSIAQRQSIINTFNEDHSYDVFLLTTRVGGLGVNLTGANRVIIYDPDWNPATDCQARERAWRIGQNRDVTIYRLLTAGTIEEKMYQRQIWKLLLTDKILINPKSNRLLFKSTYLYDLFTLSDAGTNNSSEDNNIFREARLRYEEATQKSEKKNKSHVAIEPLQSNLTKINPAVDFCNRFDDVQTTGTFEQALQISDEKSQEYRLRNSRKMQKNCIDGVPVDGVVKCEMRSSVMDDEEKTKKIHTRSSDSKKTTNDYILEKLIEKTGVSGVVQHDMMVSAGKAGVHSLKVRTEAQFKADMALEELRQARLRNWRW